MIKKIFRWIFFLLVIGLLPFVTSCKNEKLSTFTNATYLDVESIENADSYLECVQNNDPDTNSVILSPFHTLKINDTDVPVYATRCAMGIHSFVYVMVNEDEVNLKVEVTSTKKIKSVTVLPLTTGIEAKTEDNVTTCNLNDFGSFSFAFNDKYTYGLTIMVVKNEEFSLPEGYTLKEIEPGDYSGGANSDGLHTDKTKGSIELNESKTAYYFKKGHYLVHDLVVGANVEIYFEPGTYLEDYRYFEADGTSVDYTSFMTGYRANNVKIYGSVLVDYSSHQGGPANFKGRGHFGFSSCDNFNIKGIISIDSSSWTLCFTDCKNVEVEYSMIYSYKTCSDGIMLADCQDSTVHHNFVRAGDDAIEAKSTGSQGSKNLVYEYNAVWADKCRCYGCIYESNKDMDNIVFRHNSVGFSLPAWSDELGCLVVVMGTNKNVTWQNIYFEDIEIYYTKTKIMNVTLSTSGTATSTGGGNAKNIYFKDIRCYGKFTDHQEILNIKITEDCTLGKVYVSNVTYKNIKGEMIKYTQDDVTNKDQDTKGLLTTIKSVNTWSTSNVVVS